MQALRKVRWRLIIAIFIIPALALSSIVLVARVAWTMRENYGRAEVQKRLEFLQASGVAIDNASIQAAYAERTSAEHTERWLALLDQFDTAEFKRSQTGVYNFDPALDEVPFEASGDWSCEAATRDFIESHEATLQELRELCRNREPVYFPYVFRSVETLLPYTQHARTAGRLLLTDGQLAIRDRDASRLCADIEALFDSALVCSEEPFVVSQLVCIALESMTLDLLKAALEHDCLTLDELNRLLPTLVERSELKDQWQKMMRGERSMALPCFIDLHQAGINSDKPLPARGWDCIMYLDWIDKALAIDDSSLDSLLADGERLRAEFQKSSEEANWLQKADGILTGLMAPAFGAEAQAIVRNLTEKRLAAHAVATAIFRKSQGRWPKDLSELNSELDLDPATLAPPGGKPFGYRIDPDARACLWGFNLTDAHSTPPEPESLDVAEGPVEQRRHNIWHISAN